MRVLFMHHMPLEQPPVGPLLRSWALALHAAGHEARLFIVDERNQGPDDPLVVLRVVCRDGDNSADLPFDVPRFSTPRNQRRGLDFAALSDEQLAQYRDRLRRHLDSQIDKFDPHLIHAHHIWVGGQLALETGVPYVLNAWRPELIDYAKAPKYQALADQAAENAGRILAPNETIVRQVAGMFPAAADRTLVMPKSLELSEPVSPVTQAAASQQLITLYETVLEERFGKRS